MTESGDRVRVTYTYPGNTRWKVGAMGTLLPNDFESHYEYKVLLDDGRIFYFHAGEVEPIEKVG